MRIYRKEADIIQILSFPDEIVEKADYLLVRDMKLKRALLAQVIDIQFANIPGILEDLLRDVMTAEYLEGQDYDPLDVSSQISILKDTRLLICKVRGTMEGGHLTSGVSWVPSRTNSRIEIFDIENIIQEKGTAGVHLGKTKSSDLTVDLRALDGQLNIITGRKGTGKSHLSKLLVLALVDHQAPCLILDVNGEYVNLSKTKEGYTSSYSDKVHVLTPRANFCFTLKQVGLRTMLSMLTHALELPWTSARVFSSIWHELERSDSLDLASLGTLLQKWNCHESIREAIQSRYQTVVESGLFTDAHSDATHIQDMAFKLRSGRAVVVDMKNLSSVVRRMIVEILIAKLSDLLSTWKVKALFLFAEEAHLYLRETYWDDIVTRMRHLGLFTTFITNQPDTLNEGIYRQADNIFLFNFLNDHDLDMVSKAAKIDVESVRLLVKDLPSRSCLIVGEIVRNLPIVVDIKPLDVQTMGETRFFFMN